MNGPNDIRGVSGMTLLSKSISTTENGRSSGPAANTACILIFVKSAGQPHRLRLLECYKRLSRFGSNVSYGHCRSSRTRGQGAGCLQSAELATREHWRRLA